MTWRIHKSQLTSRLEQLFGEEFRQNQPLAKFTSARVGGEAELFVVVKSADELQKAAELAFEYSAPWFILGGGSNILISDHGFSGLVIQNRSRNMSFRNAGYSVLCSADSGLNLSSLTRQCINKGLGGLEWGINVPGTVGGAVFGNAGAHGADMASNVASVTLWKPGLGLKTLRKEEMKYSYRSSILKQDAQRGAIRPVILSAELQLKPEEISILNARADAYIAHRKATQPAGATLGSMFKNPEHYYAGYLIEAAGLKGHRIGGAHISQKHANFFLNDEHGTAEDIRSLLAEAFNCVYEQFAIKLEPEVELIGNWEFNKIGSRSPLHDKWQDEE